MITDFEDFCLWMYVVVDELWARLPAPYKRRSGPAPACSDSELLTLALVGECRGWRTEEVLLSEWAAHAGMFPVLSKRSRFNRRRNLRHALNAIRQAVLAVLDVAQIGSAPSTACPPQCWPPTRCCARRGPTSGRCRPRSRRSSATSGTCSSSSAGSSATAPSPPPAPATWPWGASCCANRWPSPSSGTRRTSAPRWRTNCAPSTASPADRAAPPPAAAVAADGGTPAQRRAADRRDRQRPADRAVRDRRPP